MSRQKKLRDHFGHAAGLVRQYRGITPCEHKRTVVLTRLMGLRQRELDADNLGAWAKPIVDGLRDADWLVDDKPKWCALSLRQEKAGDRVAAVRVEIDHE